MTNDPVDVTALQQQIQTQRAIQDTIAYTFAPEDDGLRSALAAAKEAGLPEIQISPLQGKLLLSP